MRRQVRSEGRVLAVSAWIAAVSCLLAGGGADAQPRRTPGDASSVDRASLPEVRMENLPDARAPQASREARQASVFDAARIDGHPVRTRALRYAEPAEAVLAALVRAWQAASPAVIRADSAGWRIASRLTDEGFETVQLRDAAAGSEGFATVWGRRRAGPPERADWLPADARWSRQIESRDADRQATTTIAALPGDARRAREAVVAAAAMRGWRTDDSADDRMRAAAQAAARSGHAVALLRRGSEQMLLTIATRPDGAALVAHRTEDPR